MASFERLLDLAGLERRTTFMAIVGPAVGAACGFVAGSLPTHFFGAKLLESIGYGRPGERHRAGHGRPPRGDALDARGRHLRR